MKRARHNASLVVGLPVPMLTMMQYLDSLAYHVRLRGARSSVGPAGAPLM